MVSSFARLNTTARVAAGVFAVFFLTATGSILLTREGHVTAPFWPSNALALVLMLRWSKGRASDAALLGAVVAAGWAANAVGGTPPPLAVGFAALNAVEIALGATLARLFAPRKFPTAASGWKFLGMVGVAPPLLAALGCWGLATLARRPDAAGAAAMWASADFLGFLLVGPFGMTVTLKQVRKLELHRRGPEAAGVAALVVASALLTFAQSRLPLLFMVLPAMLLATFRFRLIGATARPCWSP